MNRTVQRAKIAEEGARQLRVIEGGAGEQHEDKTASDESVSTEYASKLASAVEYILKTGADKMPPAHLSETPQHAPEGVMQTSSTGQLPGPGGYGHAHHQPPMNPGMQKALPQEHGSSQMANTLHEHVPGTQQLSITSGHGKTASLMQANLARMKKTASAAPVPVAAPAPAAVAPVVKTASAPLDLTDAFLATVKAAADENNPAKISAGPAVPPETNASGEPGGAPVGGMPQGPTGLVGSNVSAMNYKRNQAYANRKADLKAYLSEPALTSATDTTLGAAFAHAGEAGHKLASDEKVAAARAILSKIAEREPHLFVHWTRGRLEGCLMGAV